MRAGKLRCRVRLQALGDATDPIGAHAPFPIDLGTYSAQIEPVSGTEAVRAFQLRADVTHILTLRYGCPVTPEHRFVYGSRIFNVVSVLDVEERHRELKVQCIESVT